MMALGVVANLDTNVSSDEIDALTRVDAFRGQFGNESRLIEVKRQFSNEMARALSSRFLEDLLSTTNYTVDRHGVRISHGVVTNCVDLQQAEVNCETSLNDCRFDGEVDVSRCVFHKGLTLVKSVFCTNANFSGINVGFELDCSNTTFAGSAGFNAATIGRNANFHNAVFFGTVDFTGCAVGNQFQVQDVQFRDDSMFNGIKVGTAMFLSNTVFGGSANFGYATIGRNFYGPNMRFDSSTRSAQFYGMKVGRDVHWENSVFSGPAVFKSMEVAESLHAEGVQFSNYWTAVTFRMLKVGDFAWFTNSMFAGAVDLHYIEVGRNLEFSGARFLNATQTVELVDSRISGAALFNNTYFAKPVNFRHTRIGEDFEAQGACFDGTNGINDFADIDVEQDLRLSGAHFVGSVDFTGARIANEFEAEHASFGDPEQAVRFLGMNVGGRMSINSTTFIGPVDFTKVEIGSWLDAWGAKFKGAESNEFVDLKIRGDAVFSSAQFCGPARFRRAEIGRDLYIDHTMCGARRTDMELTSITVGGTVYCQEEQLRGHVECAGMSFRDIYAEDDTNSSEKVLAFFNLSNYSDDIYENLEQLYRRKGSFHLADGAYIAGRWREGTELPWSKWYKKLWNRFLWLTVGYGREPLRASVGGAIFVFIGYCIFKEKRMDKQDKEKPDRIYNAFWYSLDVFAPAIDFGANTYWKPKEPGQEKRRDDGRIARLYRPWHRIAGWILIPIALAAMAGIVK